MSNNPYIVSAAATPRRLLSTALGLALASSGAAALAADDVTPGTSVQAPDGGAGPSPVQTELDTVNVLGINSKNEPSSPKYTAPLRDTPQTIEVVSKEVIVEQNLLSLRDVLSTLPGITFGAGEGGGGFGDSINLRGFAASNDIQVDGVRDSAQYSRSDTFNLEQVEVTNGANSVYSGSGAVGGTINLVSKTAKQGDFNHVSAALGSDSYTRVTADSNHMIGDSTAFRINLMGHRNDAPGRDVEEFKRWGFAPSIAFGLGSDTTFTLSYLHQEDNNIPQYGIPYFLGGTQGFTLPGLDRDTYFGYANVDTQEIEVDAFTGVLTHSFNENLSLRNFSRIQQVEQFSLVDAPGGTFCLPGNRTPLGAACVVNTTPSLPTTRIVVPEGSWLPGGPRGNGRDTRNRQIVNQTDFTAIFNTGAIEHTMVNGFSFSHESFNLDGTAEFRNADGTDPYAAPAHIDFADPYRPNNTYTGPRHRTLTSKTDGEQDNAAIYAFDTLKFNEQWQLNLGARYEHNEGSSTVYTVKTFQNPLLVANADNTNLGSITGAAPPAKNSDDLFSYRAGIVFKPVESASIYLAYGNSKTPSKASVNGSCTNTSTTGTNNCNVDPETAVNWELGTKWDLLEDRLSLTAAVFRNDRQNYRVNNTDATGLAAEQQLDGRARVDGILLGASGMITDKWAVYANYTYLDSEILQGVTDLQSQLGNDYLRGDPLLSVPENALSLWTTLDYENWQFGYGASYQGSLTLTQHSATYRTGPLVESEDYWLHRAMVAYNVNRDLRLQLNVNNLFDKDYFTRIRTSASGWATPGDGRQTVLSATYSF